MVNMPLRRGQRRRRSSAPRSTDWLPALDEFEPQMIYISAGFDAHREDPLANLKFIEADYAWVTRELMRGRRASMRRAASCRRSKAATRCRRWAAASPSTSASCSRITCLRRDARARRRADAGTVSAAPAAIAEQPSSARDDTPAFGGQDVERAARRARVHHLDADTRVGQRGARVADAGSAASRRCRAARSRAVRQQRREIASVSASKPPAPSRR